MIPRFAPFSEKYLKIAAIPIVTISSMLSWSLIRNVIDISLLETITGLGAICLSIVWSMMRDGRGYWVYSIFTMRVFESPQVLESYIQRETKPTDKLLYQPFWASLVTLCSVVTLSSLVWLVEANWRYVLIGLLGGVVLPGLMLLQLSRSIRFNIVRALQSHRDLNVDRPRRRSLPGYVAEDLLLSLLINFALVLPIARKPAFSLAAGYAAPAFIIAFIILMGIVMLSMLVFASRQRRYVMLGELLNGTLDSEKVPFAAWSFTGKLTRFKRSVIWLLATLLWSILICLIFAAWPITPQFMPLYLCALLPLLVVYCAERYQTLYSNFQQAQEMCKRYQAHISTKTR
ncbi:hypothetical protein [Serratia microhaemolytica]|uniref:hypothetical protein n=1 Tax=Serratia microhaemolytica TaxID=2675110 RepID=UPI000FDD6AC7|nr:hypothetical protein [Serratia microhaemolytica]